jgi:2-polyprenyl-3-methyl-5-hydroxy-6-metoxy-1,4-benzoquinol methylase
MENDTATPVETADIETSSDAYARRFAGPAGAWMLRVQERIVLDWLKDKPGAAILDVGGGHGQLALPLAAAGYRVTVLGSAPQYARRIGAEVAGGTIGYLTGSVLDLPCADRSFDVALSIRLLPHCGRWPELIRELCRVAREAVIVDYPARASLNCFTPALFGAKKKIEGNTRPYRLFGQAEIRKAFKDQNFHLSRRKKQFFLPMVLHRLLNRPGWSAAAEAVCRRTGLTALWGSPVLVKMQRL